MAADALISVDDQGRYVLLVDPDRDGKVDHAVLYPFHEPLPRFESRFEPNVRLNYSGDSVFRRVEITRHRHGRAEIMALLEVDGLSEAESVQLSNPIALRSGIALSITTGYALWPDAREQTLQALIDRGYPTIEQARTSHISIVDATPEECPDPRPAPGSLG